MSADPKAYQKPCPKCGRPLMVNWTEKNCLGCYLDSRGVKPMPMPTGDPLKR